MSIANIARAEIRALAPYKAAAQVEDTVRLNANEAPWTIGADPFSRPLNRYPEVRPDSVRDALAKRFACEAEQLLVTRGSSEAIDLLIRAFCRADHDNILISPPTFSMYEHYARIQDAEVREVATHPETNFCLDADELFDACDDNTRLVFLCSPNNPTGNLLPRETLLEILENRKGKSCVVLDEAYIEFANENSAIELLGQYDNLVVLRTLSKALGFAGARCGAAIGPVDLIAMLNAVQAPYAVATPVVDCVQEALQSQWVEEADLHIAGIVRRRSELMHDIAELDCVERVWPSRANFFLVQFRDIGAVLKQTSADNVLLRYFGGELADCVRITVGSAEDDILLMRSLRSVS